MNRRNAIKAAVAATVAPVEITASSDNFAAQEAADRLMALSGGNFRQAVFRLMTVTSPAEWTVAADGEVLFKGKPCEAES
jgi:hypothetical protein